MDRVHVRRSSRLRGFDVRDVLGVTLFEGLWVVFV